LLRGDFKGAMDMRGKVMQAAMTEDGRGALQRKVGAAVSRARQQAMLRLAGGMELMSVRRGAWKMLEQAVLDEGGGSENFGDYEPLAYLEARTTNTECWVWRLQSRRRLIVAFRGTSDFGDVLVDIAAVPRELGELGTVHDGFSRAYASIREALHAVLARGCLGDAEGWEVLFTGHSLGGALSTLASLDFAREGGLDCLTADSSPSLPATLKGASLTACTFGAPRVGSARLCAACDESVPNTWRIYSSSDIIPTVPPTTLFGFRHPGIAVELDPAVNQLLVRGRNPGLQAAAAEEEENAREVNAAAKEAGAKRGDVWSSFDAAELSELRRVLGTGTQAVGEHMEDNYFRRIQECLSAHISSRPTGPEEGLW